MLMACFAQTLNKLQKELDVDKDGKVTWEEFEKVVTDLHLKLHGYTHMHTRTHTHAHVHTHCLKLCIFFLLRVGKDSFISLSVVFLLSIT